MQSSSFAGLAHRHFNTQLNVGYAEGRVEQARGREEEGTGQHRAGVVLGAKQDFARAEPGALEKWAIGSRTPGGDSAPLPSLACALGTEQRASTHRARRQRLPN